MKLLIQICIALSVIFISISSWGYANNYLIGQAKRDITGPAAEVVMLGYAKADQVAAGIHQRLWARAFVVTDRFDQQRVALVTIDAGMVFQGITQAVVRQLRQKLGNRYSDRNLLITATHTHSGPGGFSHYALYNISSKGFIKENFQVVVDGITDAILAADQQLKPGYILLNKGKLTGANKNRSLEAYLNNHDAEYFPAEDQQMTILKFIRQGKPIGLLSWFPTHAVSMSNANRLISGDNKGYAAYLFEQRIQQQVGDVDFVAAFAQSNAADMSPNLALDGTGPTKDAFANTRIIGERQFNKAWSLYKTAAIQLTGPVEFRHRYVNMANQQVLPEFTDGKQRETCTAALGYAFAAGTEDGRGPFSFKEGALKENPFWKAITWMLTQPSAALKRCQAPKPILLAQGNFKPFPWSPEVLPVSLLRIGQLGLLGLPAEVTVMAGRRLKTTVSVQAQSLFSHLVVAGYANAYAGYLTTQEEYNKQHYEGGSTHFGPWTLAAYRQAFAGLAQSLVEGSDITHENEPLPRDLAAHQLNFQTGVVYDQPPLFKHIGDRVTDVKTQYQSGETVEVSFWAGHPKNNLKTGSSYLFVEQLVQVNDKQIWQPVFTDNDWSTRYHWQRKDPLWGTSVVTISWQIPIDQQPGRYRIRHEGTYKKNWTYQLLDYQGTSSEFAVVANKLTRKVK
ncbi:neutral/alkaline ceramidase [Spartinivicinus ruber]|uniref:neutral/alkaline ceramidase n=1 Tax=Spartinivicinus ruber TaxID=2683272 RepID=UPI0013D2F31A|nr:neutral/alkaline ceramidase [Spartinivicinus ruber]